MTQPVSRNSEPDYPEIKFVGREQNLKRFNEILYDHDRQKWVLFFFGPGGIGKTQLIKNFIRLSNKYKDEKGSAIVPLEEEGLIDLYWTENRREETLLKNLAYSISVDQFQEFFAAYQDYENYLAEPSNNPDEKALKQEKVHDIFLDCFAKLQSELILLVFDTAEQASEAALRFFRETLVEMKRLQPGLLVVVAGRPQAAEKVMAAFPEGVCDPQELFGLSEQEVAEYLCAEGYSSVEQDLIAKLTEFVEGRPIRVALVVDWLREGNSIEELLEDTDKEKFQDNLILRITKLSYPQDWSILAMALLQRRFDEEILQVVLRDIKASQAVEQLKGLNRFSFIKYHPPFAAEEHGVCLLHDEVRDLINARAWPALDITGEMRREWIERAIREYYDPKIANSTPIHVRTLQQEKLYYLLKIDLDHGFDYYERLAAEAERDRISGVEHLEILNEEIETYQVKGRLDGRMQSVLALNWSIVLLYTKQTSRLERLNDLEKFIDSENLSLNQQARMRYRLAQGHLRSGNLGHLVELGRFNNQEPEEPEGAWYTWFKEQQRRMDLTKGERRQLLLDFGRFLTTVGQAYRSQNRMSRTADCYKESIEVFEQAGDAQEDIANAQNNLGYVYNRLGWNDRALGECQNALEVRKRLGKMDQLGYSYNVIGMIRVEQLLVEEAEKNFNLALRFFDSSGLERGRGVVLIAYGRMMRQWGEYKEQIVGELPDPNRGEYLRANEMLSEAVSIFRRRMEPADLMDALNEMGTLLRQQQKWDQSLAYYTESMHLAEKLGNKYRKIDNLVDLGILYFRKEDYPISLQYAENAAERAREIQAYYLVSKARQTAASIYMKDHKYEEAFQAGADVVAGILRLDPDRPVASATKREMEYERVLKWLKETVLFQLPSQEVVEQAIAYMIERWKTEKTDLASNKVLDDEFPGFIAAMKSVRRDYQFLREHKELDL